MKCHLITKGTTTTPGETNHVHTHQIKYTHTKGECSYSYSEKIKAMLKNGMRDVKLKKKSRKK